jgi:hypothetical protein
VTESEASAGQWLSQSEAALQLGWKLNRVISARRAGRLQSRKGNRGEWLILVPAGLAAEPKPGSDPAETDLVAELREELAELRHSLGQAEGRAETLLRQVESQAAVIDHERAERAKLAAELAEARKPVLLRLIEALRRR